MEKPQSNELTRELLEWVQYSFIGGVTSAHDLNLIWSGCIARLSQWGGGGKFLVQIISTFLRYVRGKGGKGGGQLSTLWEKPIHDLFLLFQARRPSLKVAIRRVDPSAPSWKAMWAGAPRCQQLPLQEQRRHLLSSSSRLAFLVCHPFYANFISNKQSISRCSPKGDPFTGLEFFDATSQVFLSLICAPSLAKAWNKFNINILLVHKICNKSKL